MTTYVTYNRKGNTMAVREKNTLTVDLPLDTEIVLRRTFDAPRDLVWEAFTKPEHLIHWWGPRNTTVVSCILEPRPGTTWRIVLRDADGDEIGFGGEVLEVTPPERFVWTFGHDGMPGEPGPEELLLEERNGKTYVTTRSTFPNKEVRDAVLQSGMQKGAAESYDRLEERLATLV